MKKTTPLEVYLSMHGILVAQINQPCAEDGQYVFGLIMEEGEPPAISLSEEAARELIQWLELAIERKEELCK